MLDENGNFPEIPRQGFFTKDLILTQRKSEEKGVDPIFTSPKHRDYVSLEPHGYVEILPKDKKSIELGMSEEDILERHQRRKEKERQKVINYIIY